MMYCVIPACVRVGPSPLAQVQSCDRMGMSPSLLSRITLISHCNASEIRENRIERIKTGRIKYYIIEGNTRGERGVRGCMNVGRKKTVVRER